MRAAEATFVSEWHRKVKQAPVHVNGAVICRARRWFCWRGRDHAAVPGLAEGVLVGFLNEQLVRMGPAQR